MVDNINLTDLSRLRTHDSDELLLNNWLPTIDLVKFKFSNDSILLVGRTISVSYENLHHHLSQLETGDPDPSVGSVHILHQTGSHHLLILGDD